MYVTWKARLVMKHFYIVKDFLFPCRHGKEEIMWLTSYKVWQHLDVS